MRQQELDQMKRSGLTRNAKRLARRGGPLSDNSLDRERQLLEQELEGILEREKSQKTSRRLVRCYDVKSGMDASDCILELAVCLSVL